MPDIARYQREWENERQQELRDMGCFMGDAWRGGYSCGVKVVELSFPSRHDLTWERVLRNYQNDPRYAHFLFYERD